MGIRARRRYPRSRTPRAGTQTAHEYHVLYSILERRGLNQSYPWYCLNQAINRGSPSDNFVLGSYPRSRVEASMSA
jgi:hypothetical protein